MRTVFSAFFCNHKPYRLRVLAGTSTTGLRLYICGFGYARALVSGRSSTK